MRKISIQDFIESLSNVPKETIVIVEKDMMYGKNPITGLSEKILRLSAIMHIEDIQNEH